MSLKALFDSYYIIFLIMVILAGINKVSIIELLKKREASFKRKLGLSIVLTMAYKSLVITSLSIPADLNIALLLISVYVIFVDYNIRREVVGMMSHTEVLYLQIIRYLPFIVIYAGYITVKKTIGASLLIINWKLLLLILIINYLIDLSILNSRIKE